MTKIVLPHSGYKKLIDSLQKERSDLPGDGCFLPSLSAAVRRPYRRSDDAGRAKLQAEHCRGKRCGGDKS